ncbi:MAG: endolytic transglycosylase MltG [Caldilineaceae bacterium]|nr:endolytic transglycosylase MltG [Caldilineaceae bacterium]
MNWSRRFKAEAAKPGAGHAPVRAAVCRSHTGTALSAWAVLCLAVCLAGCGRQTSEWYLNNHRLELNTPAAAVQSWQPFTVRPGSHAGIIAGDLVAAGLINDARLFTAWVDANGLDTSLQAGEYLLCPCLLIPELAARLQSGQLPGLVATVREGVRREQTAALLETLRPGTGADYLRLTGSADALDSWRRVFPFLPATSETASLEGYLFPDTYHLPDTDEAAEDLIRLQLSRFGSVVVPEWEKARSEQATALSLPELVTLASIVEREAASHAERATIAGVIRNRLASDMPLEMDATVLYGLGPPAPGETWWGRVLTRADLKHDSPFNTYLFAGLPPAPIASPGWRSLAASLQPESHNFLFFVADRDRPGRHRFAETYAEHLANVEDYWR